MEKTDHPCQFPVELIERLVLSMTNKKDWILDPFLGSGTSIISALKHGRKGVGAETNKKYVKIACDRIEQLEKGSLKTRPMNTPVYDPKERENGRKACREKTMILLIKQNCLIMQDLIFTKGMCYENS